MVTLEIPCYGNILSRCRSKSENRILLQMLSHLVYLTKRSHLRLLRESTTPRERVWRSARFAEDSCAATNSVLAVSLSPRFRDTGPTKTWVRAPLELGTFHLKMLYGSPLITDIHSSGAASVIGPTGFFFEGKATAR